MKKELYNSNQEALIKTLQKSRRKESSFVSFTNKHERKLTESLKAENKSLIESENLLKSQIFNLNEENKSFKNRLEATEIG